MIAVVVLFLLLKRFFPTSGFVDQSGSAPDSVHYEKTTTYDFEGDEVEGELLKPDDSSTAVAPTKTDSAGNAISEKSKDAAAEKESKKPTDSEKTGKNSKPWKSYEKLNAGFVRYHDMLFLLWAKAHHGQGASRSRQCI